ncbi:hypothetical protein [Streptomyces sp. Act143]|uniref:hypothetical protein n=1 Tax=Streptomyces sp. Act143 TaxID=2200760 RepID=UPI0015E80C9E|nr:hypothetical protein [Streptomyces sp. Act143]
MSDARTIEPPHTDVQESTGHGKHRGQVSARDGESAPRGRHRKPAEETESAA